MNYGWHEVCDGLVHCHQSSFDASILLAQLSEHNNILKNQLREIGVNDGRKTLHSSVRAIAKEYVANNKKDKTELGIECNENNTVKVENVQMIQIRKWMVIKL